MRTRLLPFCPARERSVCPFVSVHFGSEDEPKGPILNPSTHKEVEDQGPRVGLLQ